jgi:hypothetical protein
MHDKDGTHERDVSIYYVLVHQISVYDKAIPPAVFLMHGIDGH